MRQMIDLKKVLVCMFLSYTIPAYSQLITEQFTNSEFLDDFNTDKQNWPVFNDENNFFVIQNGEYILNRKDKTAQYAALTEWDNKLESFDIKASVKLMKAKDDNCNIGIIIMAKAKGDGFVIEINRNLQYRVKQLVGTAYKYISGNGSNFGWVKSSDIKPVGQYNTIEVKCLNKNYDVFINGIYKISFDEKNYT